MIEGELRGRDLGAESRAKGEALYHPGTFRNMAKCSTVMGRRRNQMPAAAQTSRVRSAGTRGSLVGNLRKLLALEGGQRCRMNENETGPIDDHWAA